MQSKKVWVTLNISLGIIVIILFLSLFNVGLPNLGRTAAKMQYNLDPAQEVFMINVGNEFNFANDLNRFCLEARQQLDCEKVLLNVKEKKLDWVCRTGENYGYWMNNKAYNYCLQQSFW